MVNSLTNIGVALLLAYCIINFKSQSPSLAQAQDLLRQRQPNIPTNNNNNNNPLASIQLPPELASLTPQQLHQLAQLRELQLQQAAQQQQQGNNNNNNQQGASNVPAPIGVEALPTTQPSSSNNAQIPQPNAASSLTSGPNQSSFSSNNNNDPNDRHDDGAYNESGSEMEGVMQSGNEASGSSSSPSASSSSSTSASGGSNSAPQAAPTFEVNWNKCPQLEPSESEKNKKTQVITKCLQSAPIPTNLTRENVETHREQIATCALKVEGWFDDQGNYKYDKAESEIRGKKLESNIELQVLKFHVACKDEASKKFPRDQNKLIDQVQFYQACMDYYISIVCEIEVSVDQ